VPIPFALKPENVFKTLAELQAALLVGDLRIDVSEMQHIEVMGALLLGAGVRRARAERSALGLPPPRIVGKSLAKSGHDFAKFLRLWDLMEGGSDQAGEFRLSRGHLPISRLSYSQLRRESGGLDPIRSELVLRVSAHLAESLVSGHGDDELHDVITHSISELLRNVFEHSQSDDAWIACATRWGDRDTDPEAQIVVLDDGCGLLESLRRNPSLAVRDDHDAISKAMQYGVSRAVPRRRSTSEVARLREEFPGQDPSFYDNHGYGLWVLSRFASLAGKLTIVSGAAAQTLFRGGGTFPCESFHRGTMVGLTLFPKEIQGVRAQVFAEQNRSSGRGRSEGPLISASLVRRLGLDRSP
jgi:hypothetical protein